MAEVLIAIAITLSVQALTSVAMIAPSVLAPVASADLGTPPQNIGLFVAATYLAAMFAGLSAGGLIRRWGPLRLSQLSLLLPAAGLALGDFGVLVVMPIAAVLIGVGYGWVNPTSSHILSRRSPPRMMSLIFSIKQTGVPIGGAVAGALVPTLLLEIGWQRTLLLLAIVCGLAALALQPARAAYDAERSGLHPRSPGGRIAGMGRPIRLALTHPGLREMAFASFAFAGMQLVLITYLVSYLNLQLGYTLVAAGLVYSCAHIAGVVGRVVWGAAADHVLPPAAMLGLLGIAMAASSAAAALFTPAWPLAAVIAVSTVYGATAVGWNGVYLAEVARRAPAGDVGTATGGTQFFTFFGALSAPPIFAGIVSLTGSYSWGFAAFGVLPLAVGLRLLLAARASNAEPSP